MSFSNDGRFRQQVRFLQQQFAQDGELPFTDVLSEATISHALEALEIVWLDRIYTPLVTLWVFLGQALSQDHSCRAAVARLIAHRVSRGQRRCSAETSAYCQARKRLPEEFFATVARKTGQALDGHADQSWLWKNRRVLAYDGSTVSMPDTADNQQAYPQPPQQAEGLGFPLARIAVFFSLSCGAIIELAICSYSGKGHSELGMLRKLWEVLRSGDIMLADRYMCSWYEIFQLRQRGIHTVTRLHHCRKADFRRGKRLGKGDHLVEWPRPHIRTIDNRTRKGLPDQLTMRETRVLIQQPGFRSRSIIVVTTLLDAEEVTASDLADLYRARWNAELDLRSLKQTLQMDILRCKTPELVRKEIWTHILAYNLIRTVMAQAASKQKIKPRTISFKGAVQTLEAFQPVIAMQGQHGLRRADLYNQLLEALATHRVADRPDRFEPRQRKRRQKKYDRMMKPRNEVKREILKRLG
ncbi:IS4 family transposase [Blastopirellula sp. J2-11]|uniref:IS4 family transposase n=1 Tax=Blastopirellula sp. J2-11 TaxID=2943192 RepID=UPI0021CA05D0|nr:IS4 family transposase [Blastopirellula sp. J2-11]UUO07868.1 IS4 family transposase [Blastopirellula sp. J2-11]